MRYILSILLLLIPAQAMAAATVGKALVDGRIVILFDDNSWAFEDELSGNTTSETRCDRLSPKVSMCIENDIYRQIAAANDQLLAQYQRDDRNYAMLIEEELGSDDGNTIESMRSAIITNMKAGGAKEEDTIFLGAEDGQFQDLDMNTVFIATKLDGFNLVYSFSVVISPKSTYQLISYSVGNELTDEMRSHHEEFLSFIDINFE